MIKYRTCSRIREIEKVEVIKETEKSVWLSEKNREAKVSKHRIYFDTWEQAKKYIKPRLESCIKRLESETNSDFDPFLYKLLAERKEQLKTIEESTNA